MRDKIEHVSVLDKGQASKDRQGQQHNLISHNRLCQPAVGLASWPLGCSVWLVGQPRLGKGEAYVAVPAKREQHGSLAEAYSASQACNLLGS